MPSNALQAQHRTAPVTALVVRVPEAERLVGDLRMRFDPSAALGAPPHVTVLFPFAAPGAVTPELLADAQAACSATRSFAFSLGSVGRWPTVAFLYPEPAVPFVRLVRRMCARFPRFAPYEGRHGDVVPHLTVANGTPDDAKAAASVLRARLRETGAIRSFCSAVEMIENASGRWRTMHAFPLRGPAAGPPTRATPRA